MQQPIQDDLVFFANLIEAVRPWHQHLVIVGGWAHRLHRLIPEARVPSHAPIRTLDADLAFDVRTELHGDIGSALRASGFRDELATEHDPPVTWYRLGQADGFYAEFITPLIGAGTRRDGTADVTEARAGVTAQKLRYVDLLIATPMELSLAPASEIPVSGNATVLLAHPACFIAQKLLIASRRIPAKQAQDALYVHDTLELFSGSLGAFNAHWNSQVRPLLHARTLSKLWSEVGKQYGNTTDIHRRSVLIPQDRVLDPERLRAVCKLGLERLFDPRQIAPIFA